MENKIPNITRLVTTAVLNKKATEIENKTSHNINNIPQKRLGTNKQQKLKTKIFDINDLATKAVEIEKKTPDIADNNKNKFWYKNTKK